jgi:dienelactone hydrolase
MKKVAYIIPGYGESHTRQKGYGAVAEMFRARGITPLQVEIDWSKKPGVFGDYVKQFLKQYKKPKGTRTYVLGFSFGATTALLSASKAKPDILMLCSLSPYFDEDLKALRPAWVRWWKKNIMDSNYSFAKLAATVAQETYVIVGREEDISCIRRAKDAKRKIRNSSLLIAKGAKHKIGQKEYLAAVEKVIAKL